MEAVQLALPTTAGLGWQGVALNHCCSLMWEREGEAGSLKEWNPEESLGNITEFFLGALFVGQPWALISQLCSTSFTNSHSLASPAYQCPYLPQADLFPSIQFTQSAFSMDILILTVALQGKTAFSFVHGACIPGIMSLLSYLQLRACVLLVPWPW